MPDEVECRSVLVLGNGNSRKVFDLDALHTKFFTVGCNALYRDFAPDILVATDVHITAEIVHSGYTKQHKCYFRDWILHPAEVKDMLKLGFEVVTDFHKDEPFIVTTGLTDVTSDIEAVASELVIFGVDADDISSDLKTIGCDMPNKETMEFVGPNAVDVATKCFEGVKNIFILGFDFGSYGPGHPINNVYAGTPNYRDEKSAENEKILQSLNELKRVIRENRHITFHYVCPHSVSIAEGYFEQESNVEILTRVEFMTVVDAIDTFR